MGAMQEVFVPDIGDFKSVDVIEILVKPGDTVAAEQSLVTLESDKATMEIPSPSAGVVKEVRVKIGDKVSEGSPILAARSGQRSGRVARPGSEAPAPAESAGRAGACPRPHRHLPRARPALAAAGGGTRQVEVPDIGDFKSVDVIEILVKPGDTVAVEQSLVTLESDKATMEVPSPAAGKVKEILLKVGDKVAQGSPILVLEAAGGAPARPAAPAPAAAPSAAAPKAEASAPAPSRPPRSRWNPRPSRRAQSRTQARRCASSRASSASICPG